LQGWGGNIYQQISLPTSTAAPIVAIAAANTHSLALLSNGTVIGWGRNNNGQLTIPTPI
jgi:alpha-tubulin suppressor-like RCC1 family protein